MIEPGQKIKMFYSGQIIECISRSKVRRNKKITVMYRMQTDTGTQFDIFEDQVANYLEKQIWQVL